MHPGRPKRLAAKSSSSQAGPEGGPSHRSIQAGTYPPWPRCRKRRQERVGDQRADTGRHVVSRDGCEAGDRGPGREARREERRQVGNGIRPRRAVAVPPPRLATKFRPMSRDANGTSSRGRMTPSSPGTEPRPATALLSAPCPTVRPMVRAAGITDLEAVPVLTGELGALSLMIWIDAAEAGEGVNAERLRDDAVAAQRGDAVALGRLRAAVKTRGQTSVSPPRRDRRLPRRVPRSRRVRSSRCVRRARSPGRRSDDLPSPRRCDTAVLGLVAEREVASFESRTRGCNCFGCWPRLSWPDDHARGPWRAL